MHQRCPVDVAISALGDPAILRPLIKGAPAALKPFFIAKQDEMQRDLSLNELISLTRAVDFNEEAELVRREVPTWAVLMRETIKHAQEMGWDEIPAEMKNTGCSVRQTEQSHQNGSENQNPLSTN